MTSEPPQMSLTELRRLLDVLLHHIEVTTASDVVSVDKDYFWSVPSDELYDNYNEPTRLTLGQISESWHHLRDLLADEDHVLGHHLVWLADVLRAIGHCFPA
ncbi:hypothetical protein ACFYT3_31755 [Nocardia amikacinitolerans]|uniref:hypothetical protein n=1 Tax=Nocardia amikacinitolerans TaxID=756689 RepID=UPI003687DB9A